VKLVRTVVAGVLVVFALVAATRPAAADGQAPEAPPAEPAQTAFEAGQYDRTVELIGEMRAAGTAGLDEAFLAAQARLRQNQLDAARQELSQLVAAEHPVWRAIGESATALADGNVDQALDAATRAVAQANERAAQAAEGISDPEQATLDFHAHYELGLVQARREDWGAAVEAFERAAGVNPRFAYASYYAGMAASRAGRPDRVAIHFERFLQLAPNAPERSAVMAIMRTIRGA
jgi:tetratricopeptide (TPR) repeat protein